MEPSSRTMQPPDNAHRLTSKKSLPGCSAFLLLDGQPVENLGDAQYDKKLISYVEAKEGVMIEGGWIDDRVQPTEEGFVVSMLVDGKVVTAATFTPHDAVFFLHKHHPKRISHFRGQLSDDTHLRRLRLDRISFSDDDTQYCSNQSDIDKLGTVQITYCRINNLRRVEPAYPEALSGLVLEQKPEKEKDLPSDRATHQAHAAESVEDEPQTLIEWTYIPDPDATSSGEGFNLAPLNSAYPPPPPRSPSLDSRLGREDPAAKRKRLEADRERLEAEIETASAMMESDGEEDEEEEEGMEDAPPQGQALGQSRPRTATVVQDGFASAGEEEDERMQGRMQGRAPAAAPAAGVDLGEIVVDSSDGEDGEK
ncbi:hypothetical protein JCM6882_005799 [Rhodosporidiobolus microsporus]